MLNNPTFCGVVLAGGKSSRMGQDKAMLTIDGESLLDRAIRLLNATGANQVLVSRNNQPDTLQDIFPFQGPLAGIHAALCATEQNLLVIPVDMPLLTVSVLLPLIEKSTPGSASYYNGFPVPAYIANTIEIKRHLEQILKTKDNLSVRGFLNQIGAKSLPPSAPEILVNTNTPEEWHNLNALLLIDS